MAGFTIPGLGGTEKVNEIRQGWGYVLERTILLGEVVIAVSNIGSMRVVDGVKDSRPLVFALVSFMFGLALVGVGTMAGLFFFAMTVGFAYWFYVQKVDRFLLIGTCDGRQTNVNSKNRADLEGLRDFLREKIEKKDSAMGARIVVNQNRVQVERMSVVEVEQMIVNDGGTGVRNGTARG